MPYRKIWSWAALPILALLAQILAAPLSAEEPAKGADLSQTESCVAAALKANSSPADCLATLHAPCLNFPASASPQSALCFVETRKSWDQRIKDRLEKLADDPAVAAVASIESRYDLMANLLQCDRLDELSALYKMDEDQRLLQKTRCEAAAAGLAYIRLLVRAGDVE